MGACGSKPPKEPQARSLAAGEHALSPQLQQATALASGGTASNATRVLQAPDAGRAQPSQHSNSSPTGAHPCPATQRLQQLQPGPITLQSLRTIFSANCTMMVACASLQTQRTQQERPQSFASSSSTDTEDALDHLSNPQWQQPLTLVNRSVRVEFLSASLKTIFRVQDPAVRTSQWEHAF